MALLLLAAPQGLTLGATLGAPSRPATAEVDWNTEMHVTSMEEAPRLDILLPDSGDHIDLDVLNDARRAYFDADGEWAPTRLDDEPLGYEHLDYEVGAFSLAADARQ